MSHWQIYQKPKYGQDDTVWVDQGAGKQPAKGQVLFYIGRRTYEVALSNQGVRVVRERALTLRTEGGRR